LRVRGTSTIAEFDIGLFVKPDRRVHCLRSTGTRECTVNALRDRKGVRVAAPIESSSLDAASGRKVPARARNSLSGAGTSVVSRLTGVQHSDQLRRIIAVRHANFPKPRNALAISAQLHDTTVCIIYQRRQSCEPTPHLRASPSQGHSLNTMPRNTCEKQTPSSCLHSDLRIRHG
jgi:hypothetical protein